MAGADRSLVDARGRKYLTRAERERFLDAARVDLRPVVQTFVSTLAHTGGRISQVLAICTCDVDCATVDFQTSIWKRRHEHWREVPAIGRYSSAMTWAIAAPIRPAAASISSSARCA